MFGLKQNVSQKQETASEFLKRSLERIFHFDPYKATPAPEFGAGWTKVPAPNVSKLQRRAAISSQAMNNSISVLELYRTLFSLLLKTQYVSLRNRVYDFKPPYWKLKVVGWRNFDLDLTVFSASGTSTGRTADHWKFEGLWAFDTFEVDLSDLVSCQTSSDRKSLIRLEDYADLFVQPRTGSEDRDYDGKMYKWNRSQDGLIASTRERAAYGTENIKRLSVHRFQGALLPTFDLPKNSRLYAAEQFYSSYN